MRVLFVVNPEKAHFYAMVPLAWALRTAGHEVLVASQPRFTDVITQAGLTAAPVGRDVDLWALLPRKAKVKDWTWQPRYGLLDHPPYDVVESPEKVHYRYMNECYYAQVHEWHKPGSFPMIAGLVEFARQWLPDLVLWEPLAFAGPIAARACGAAHGRLLWGVDVFGRTRSEFLRMKQEQPEDRREDPLASWLGGYARKFGTEFDEDMVTGQFSVDQLPDSMRLPADGATYVPMRYVPYGGPASVPAWLHAKPERPRVGLSMGVSLSDHGAAVHLSMSDVLDRLSKLDIEVVATIPRSEQQKLDSLPDNVRVVTYAPLDALAATCSAMITHGGFGTFLTTALHGVPQLSVAWDFDSPLLARRAAARGGSIELRADEATGDIICDSVARLLDDPELGKGAVSLREELADMPSPNDLVGPLAQRAIDGRAR